MIIICTNHFYQKFMRIKKNHKNLYLQINLYDQYLYAKKYK